METPSSTKRITRSQTLASNSNFPISRKIEDSEKGVSKSRRRNVIQQQQDRSALIDITNDSPIVGLAMVGLETPSSAIAKQKSFNRGKNSNTPGSGEALLRGQVKTLLQKVEEEAEISKISLENRPFLHLQEFSSSPMGLLAPTPANTPQIPNLSGDDRIINNNGSASDTPLPVIEEQLMICQVASEIFDENKKKESLESEKSLTRSLMLDFSEKSEISDLSSECSSVLTTCKTDKSSPTKDDDDSASNWSVQVNASTNDEDEEEQIIEEEKEEEEEEDYYYTDDDYDNNGGLIDELCEGIGKISMNENNNNNSMAAAKFRGKHTRFSYNSDDEIVEKEICSTSALHLKGLPTPKGMHLRFPMEED